MKKGKKRKRRTRNPFRNKEIPPLKLPDHNSFTVSVKAAARACGMSIPWVQLVAREWSIGHLEGRQRRFSRRDLKYLYEFVGERQARLPEFIPEPVRKE